MTTENTETIDLGEEVPSVAPEEVIDLGDTRNTTAVSNPDYAARKARKVSFATGLDEGHIRQQFELGAEESLRQSVAASAAVKEKVEANKRLLEIASNTGKPLTVDDLEKVRKITESRPQTPDTILEDTYGKAFSKLMLGDDANPDVKKTALDNDVDNATDLLDAVGQAISRRETARDIAQEVANAIGEKTENFTPGAAALGVLKGAANALTRPFGNIFENKEAEGWGVVGDYAKMFLPAYSNIILGGTALSVGDSLEDQYSYFALLPPSQFKKEFGDVVRKIAAENLPLAQQYANGYIQYSSTDQAIDNWLGYADWLGAAFSALGVANKARKIARPAAKGPAIPPAPTPSVPTPTSPAKPTKEQIQDLKDFAASARAHVRAASVDDPVEAKAVLGDIDGAAEMKVHEQLKNEFRELAPVDDTADFENKFPSLFKPEDLTLNAGSLTTGQTTKLLAHARRSANELLSILTNNHAITRLTPEQLEDAVRIGKEQMIKQYGGANDAILDVGHGGGFRVWTPEEQAFNAHTLEMRLGRIESPKAPETKTPPSRTAEAPKAPSPALRPTGDAFLDAINTETAKGGRMLVRDLYDRMKKTGQFKGTLSDFRKQVEALRRGKKVKMTPHDGQLPNPLPPQKPKSIPVKERPKGSMDRLAEATVLDKGYYDVDELRKSFDKTALEKEINSLRIDDETNTFKGKSGAFVVAFKVNDDPDWNGGVLAEMLRTFKNKSGKNVTEGQVRTVRRWLEGKSEVVAPSVAVDNQAKDFNAFREAYLKSSGGHFARRVRIADLRKAFPGKSKEQFDKMLLGMQSRSEIALYTLDVPSQITKADKEAAITVGGIAERHIVYMENAEPRPVRNPVPLTPQKAETPVPEDLAEEGNFTSEFSRDSGYGNTSLRNRIIDSEFVVKPRGKFNSPVRAHYIEPPEGFPSKPAVGTTTKPGTLKDKINKAEAKAIERAKADLEETRRSLKEELKGRTVEAALSDKSSKDIVQTLLDKGETLRRQIEEAEQRVATFDRPPGAPQTDADLMAALTGLMAKVEKTGNNDLWHKLSKFLDVVERRQVDNLSLEKDTRQFDLENLGSPYGSSPYRAPEDTVESRTRRINPKTKKPEPFRNAVPEESDIITGRKGRSGTSFVGRQYTNQEAPPAKGRKLSESDYARYVRAEQETYKFLNEFAVSNKVPYEIKMGKPTASLFKNRKQAAYYGTDVYGLSPNQFRVKQQGKGYYISVSKILDETYSTSRDLQITTQNQSSDKLLDALFGTFISPSNYMGRKDPKTGRIEGNLSQRNRKTVTYGPQELHRRIQEASDNLKTLPSGEREELREILIANRDHEYTEGPTATIRRGRFNTTVGGLEMEWKQRFGKLPSEKQTAAYFEYTRLYDLDLAMRELALVRDMGRLGLERTRLSMLVEDVSAPGTFSSKMSKPFSSREIDKLPMDDPDGENFGVYIHDPTGKPGQFFLRTDITKDVLDDIEAKVATNGYKILELGNPLEKPVRAAAKTDEIINFIVVRNFEKRKYDWTNIPKRPGGHVVYQDPFFISQPIIRRADQSGAKRHIYEGDEHLLNLTTEAQAKKLLPHLETARELLKAGRMDELERHLAEHTPFEMDQWTAFFKERVAADGSVQPPKFNIEDPFTWRANGRNTMDMEHFKDAGAKYPNFVNAIRSKYNLFASNVDKKFLGQRDPDLPSVTEYQFPGKEPAMKLSSPRLIDPLETINSSLANVVRSKYLSDYKIQAAENFIQEFHTVMTTPLETMRRNPVFYLHNPVWDTSTDNLPKILNGKHVRQAHLNMIGTESTVGKAMSWAYDRVTDSIYQRFGQAKADSFTDTFRNAENPVDFARAVVFHTKLGLFNVAQLVKQSIHFTNITAIEGPAAAARSIPQYYAARWLALTDDPAKIDGIINHLDSSWGKAFGFDGKRFRESYLELKKTGVYNVGGEYAARDDFFDQKVFKSTAGEFFDKGTFFFKEGERFPRLVGWFIAYDKWRAANPSKAMSNADRAQVLDRADLLTFRMARDSNANIQQGSFAVPTQFFSYAWRMAELVWGGQFTRAERARLVLTNAALWGIPMSLTMASVAPFYDDIRQSMLEQGVDLTDTVISALHDGIVSTAFRMISGNDTNINQALGPGGLSTVREVFTGEKGMLEFALGATGSVVGDMLKSSHGAYNFLAYLADMRDDPPTAADFVEFTKNISTVNNAIKAYYLYNAQSYFTKNEDLIINDANGMDAFLALIAGVTPRNVGDNFLMLKSMKEQSQAEAEAGRYAAKYIRRALRAQEAGDTLLMETNMRQAKTAFEASGMSPDKWAKYIRDAYNGDKPLFEKVLNDFVRRAPESQKMDRAIAAEKRSKE